MYANVIQGVVISFSDQPPEGPIIKPRSYAYSPQAREALRRQAPLTPPRQIVDPGTSYEDWYAPWVPVPDELVGQVAPGWRYDGSAFSPPLPPD